jgi:hypothetical protein
MSKEIMEKIVKISSSTTAEVVTLTTQIIKSSTQPPNIESVTIETS